MENVKYIPGDLVKDKYQSNEIFEVTNTSKYGYMLKSIENDVIINSTTETLIGIPLTPQILEANGWKMGSFERDEDDFLFQPCYKRGSILNFDYYSELSIKPVVKETRSFLSAISDIKEIRLRKIEFVHQLQHLLFGLGLDSSLKV